MQADEFLLNAATTLKSRGKDYDSSQNRIEERSMKKTIEAFNSITGNELNEEDGWLILLLLKQTRQYSSTNYHHDSAIDSVGYAALLAECLSTNKPKGLIDNGNNQ